MKTNRVQLTGYVGSDLSVTTTSKRNKRVRAHELYDIAHAIGVNPCELLEFICGDVKKRLKS
jgi:hypothetical protein